MPLLGSPASFASSACSQAFSCTSPPPVVDFPPTSIFPDPVPEGLVQKAEPSFVPAETPRTFVPRNPDPLQDSCYPISATRSFGTVDEVATSSGAWGSTSSNSNSIPRQRPIKFLAPTGSVRHGYWNRCGDHLTL
jgi:hypothetical protein